MLHCVYRENGRVEEKEKEIEIAKEGRTKGVINNDRLTLRVESRSSKMALTRKRTQKKRKGLRSVQKRTRRPSVSRTVGTNIYAPS